MSLGKSFSRQSSSPPGARSLHKMKCRAIALQIKTSREVDGNHVSSKWIHYEWRCYNITIDSWTLVTSPSSSWINFDMGSWVLRWWRETDFLLSSLCGSKYLVVIKRARSSGAYAALHIATMLLLKLFHKFVCVSLHQSEVSAQQSCWATVLRESGRYNFLFLPPLTISDYLIPHHLCIPRL